MKEGKGKKKGSQQGKGGKDLREEREKIWGKKILGRKGRRSEEKRPTIKRGEKILERKREKLSGGGKALEQGKGGKDLRGKRGGEDLREERGKIWEKRA